MWARGAQIKRRCPTPCPPGIPRPNRPGSLHSFPHPWESSWAHQGGVLSNQLDAGVSSNESKELQSCLLSSVDTGFSSMDPELSSVDTELSFVDTELSSMDTELSSMDTELSSVDPQGLQQSKPILFVDHSEAHVSLSRGQTKLSSTKSTCSIRSVLIETLNPSLQNLPLPSNHIPEYNTATGGQPRTWSEFIFETPVLIRRLLSVLTLPLQPQLPLQPSLVALMPLSAIFITHSLIHLTIHLTTCNILGSQCHPS